MLLCRDSPLRPERPYPSVRRVSRPRVAFLIERSFRLQNLAANLTAGVCGCVEIEIPLTIHQLLSLFLCQGRHPINGTCYRVSLYRKLRLRIRPRRCRSVKVRSDDRTSQPTELDLKTAIESVVQNTRFVSERTMESEPHRARNHLPVAIKP